MAIGIVIGAIAALIGAAYLLSVHPIAIYIPIAIAIGLIIAIVYQGILIVYYEIEYRKKFKG